MADLSGTLALQTDDSLRMVNPSRQTKYPGFDLIRLAAAWAVVFSHLFLIADGPGAVDPLEGLFGKGNSLGNYAVYTFFILSGLLLSQSLDFNRDPVRFLLNRLLRVVPGFIFAILISVLCLAPLITGRGFIDVWFCWDTWDTIYWSIESLRDYTGPSLSYSKYEAVGCFLNGSLWSISYEVLYYLMLLALFLLLRRTWKVSLAAFVIGTIALLGPKLGFGTTRWDEATGIMLRLPYSMMEGTMPYFCAGVSFYGIQKVWPVTARMAVISAGLMGLAAWFRVPHLAFALLGPFLVTYLGSLQNRFSQALERFGDISFGTYLFGWPVGLLVMAKWPVLHPLAAFLISAPLVFGFAFIMNRWVEQPAQKRLRPWLLSKVPRMPLSISGRDWQNQRVAFASVFCGIMLIRYPFFPYPLSANWFGGVIYQILGVCWLTLWIAGVLKPGAEL